MAATVMLWTANWTLLCPDGARDRPRALPSALGAARPGKGRDHRAARNEERAAPIAPRPRARAGGARTAGQTRGAQSGAAAPGGAAARWGRPMRDAPRHCWACRRRARGGAAVPQRGVGPIGGGGWGGMPCCLPHAVAQWPSPRAGQERLAGLEPQARRPCCCGSAAQCSVHSAARRRRRGRGGAPRPRPLGTAARAAASGHPPERPGGRQAPSPAPPQLFPPRRGGPGALHPADPAPHRSPVHIPLPTPRDLAPDLPARPGAASIPRTLLGPPGVLRPPRQPPPSPTAPPAGAPWPSG
jgi:hypothetical protein